MPNCGSASFGQTSVYIATDCPCTYYFYLEGNHSMVGQLGGAGHYEWQGSISTDPAGATMAIKKPGYGVVLGPEPLPPVDGTVLNEDCHPVPDCDCVLEGHSYTPNLQVHYDVASHSYVGKLTCKYHP